MWSQNFRAGHVKNPSEHSKVLTILRRMGPAAKLTGVTESVGIQTCSEVQFSFSCRTQAIGWHIPKTSWSANQKYCTGSNMGFIKKFFTVSPKFLIPSENRFSLCPLGFGGKIFAYVIFQVSTICRSFQKIVIKNDLLSKY